VLAGCRGRGIGSKPAGHKANRERQHLRCVSIGVQGRKPCLGWKGEALPCGAIVVRRSLLLAIRSHGVCYADNDRPIRARGRRGFEGGPAGIGPPHTRLPVEAGHGGRTCGARSSRRAGLILASSGGVPVRQRQGRAYRKGRPVPRRHVFGGSVGCYRIATVQPL
jgi:hypothetical protein